MTVLDSVIITIALPAITSFYSADIIRSQWTVTGYMLAMTTFMLIFARLDRVLGKNLIFLSGILLFTLTSLGCAFSPDLSFLIAMRIIQGIGAAMIVSLIMALFMDHLPGEKQAKGMGLMGAAVALATLSGPFLGGILIDLVNWQAIFLINVPIGLIVFIIGLYSLDTSLPCRAEKFSMDWIGSFSYLSGVTSCMLFFAGGAGFMNNQVVWMYGVISLVAAIIFVTCEHLHPRPLLDLSIFKNQGFVVSLLAIIMFSSAALIVNVSLPFYFEIVWQYSAFQVGLVFMLISGILTIGSPLVGRLYDKISWNHFPTAGLGLGAIGLLLFAFTLGSASLILILAALIVYTIGYALFQSPVNIEVMRSLPKSQAGIASSISSTARYFAMSLGSSLAVLVYALYLQSEGGGISIMQSDPQGIQTATMIAMAGAGLICLAGCVIRGFGLGKKMITDSDS